MRGKNIGARRLRGGKGSDGEDLARLCSEQTLRREGADNQRLEIVHARAQALPKDLHDVFRMIRRPSKRKPRIPLRAERRGRTIASGRQTDAAAQHIFDRTHEKSNN